MSPHCHSPGSASAPATSAGSAPDSELCICSTIQHHDDFSARAAKCAADQHQSAAEQHTTRHSRGHLHTGPTDPVGRQPKLILGEILLFKLSCFSRQSLWFSYSILISHFILSRFPAGQQLVTKLVTAPMACGAVMVPTSMFMGQVVTAYNPFGGQQVSTKPYDS